MIAAFALLLAAPAWAVVNQTNLQKGLDALPGLLQNAVSSGLVPGIATAVVYQGKVVYSAGFGIREAGKNDSVTPETVFQIASMSKPISSTTVAAIATKNSSVTWEGSVNEPERVADYADAWITKELVIADGFSHRSGLFGVAGDDLELFGYNRSLILSRLQYMQPTGRFRIKYQYSNYGITTAAVAAATYIGKTWEDAIQQYLYGPLGMSSTSSRYSDFQSRSNRAALHNPSGGVAGNGSWVTVRPRNPDAQAPAGGVTSNVQDLAKWVQLHLALGKLPSGEQLIDQTPLNQTRQPIIVRGPNPITGEPGFYGYGWNVDYRDDRIYIDHAGAFTQGARSHVKLSISDGLGIVSLSNCFPTGVPDAISDILFDYAHYGAPQRDYIAIWNGLYQQLVSELGGSSPYKGNPPANASAMLPAQSYAGLYQNNYVGIVQIAAGGSDGGELTMSFPGSSNVTKSLKHWDRDTFYKIDDRDDPSSGIFFTIGSDGTANSITIDSATGNGGGTLARVIQN